MNEKTNASVTFNGVSVYEISRVISRDPPIRETTHLPNFYFTNLGN